MREITRLGVFGGTFDPVHRAHIELARLAINQCHLSSMLLVPCHLPPHRETAMATGSQRVEMLKLAVADLPNIGICDYELQQQSTSYTHDTLVYLKERQPEVQLVFCMGGDSLRDFTHWRNWQQILELANIAVLARGTDHSHEIAEELKHRMQPAGSELTESAGQICYLAADPLSISATTIRDRLLSMPKGSERACIETYEQDPILGKWLNPDVLEYIINNQVYQ